MATSSKTTEFDAIIAGDLTNKTPFASTDLDETSITSTNSSSDSTLSEKYLVMASSSSSTDEAAANITSKNSIMKNTRNSNPELQASNTEFVPPDGGCRAWLVMICAFLCNGVIFGIHNSGGSLFVDLKEKYGEDSSKGALVVSLGTGATFGLSAISSLLADKYGIQKTALFGAILAFLGMLLSAFAVDRLELLYVTYGLMFGGGASLVYSPSLVILGHYFKKRMGIVNGFVAAGSSIFTIVMPHILQALLKSVGLQNTFFSWLAL